jgi:hypothetical protein
MKSSEIPDIYIGHYANVPTLPSVTTIRTAIRHILLAEKAYATVTTVTGFENNFSLVVEHTCMVENILSFDEMIAQPLYGVNATKKEINSPQ